MARIKIDGLKPITITTIADYSIVGASNLKLVKIVGTYVDAGGFIQQTPINSAVTVITNVNRIAWYQE